MRIFTTIALFVFSAIMLNAQVNFFTASEVDASQFPNVKAGFRAYDGAGNPFLDLVPDDFTIIENGISVDPNTIEIVCDFPPLSIVLVIDQSRSMSDEVNGEVIWDWVKEGVKTFLEEVPLNSDESQISIVTFGTIARVRADWTRDKEDLKDVVNNLSVQPTSTNFNAAFLDERFGAISQLKNTPVEHGRIIVFLTDGKHETLTESLHQDSIITELRQNNIQVYAITLLDEQNPELNVIAAQSGGDYQRVTTRKSLTNLYDDIANKASEKQSCVIKWQSNPACDEITSYRIANINLNRLQNRSVNRTYKAPPGTFVSISSDQNIYDFGNPEINEPIEKDITITADNFPMLISNFRLMPNVYFDLDFGDGYGQPLAEDLLLDVGESFTFKARFTQLDQKTPRQSTLICESLPCNYEVSLLGGYSQIQVINPEDQDLYSVCDFIDIVWTGVEQSVEVDLYYSRGNGNWVPIAQRRTGLTYRWNNPPNLSGNYRIRASVTPQSAFKWATSDGGSGNEYSTSLDVTPNDLFVYVCGYFNGTTQIAGEQFESVDDTDDAFVAKYDSDGNSIWVRTIEGDNSNRALGLVSDSQGAVYVVGYVFKGVKFGNYTPGLQEEDMPYAFIAKYTNAGDLADAKFIGARNIFTNFRAVGERIRLFNDDGVTKIMIRGRYQGEFQDFTNGYQLPEADNYTPFTAVYSLGLELENLYPAGTFFNDYSNNRDNDSDGNLYETGTFTGSRNFGGNRVTSKGENDFYISKFGPLDVSTDISDEFEIDFPRVQLNINEHDFEDCILGDTCRVTLRDAIENIGRFNVTIEDVIVAGNFPDDFLRYEDIIGEILAPGEKLDIIARFMPQYFGARSGKIIIKFDCHEDLEIELKGRGTCRAYFTSPLEFEDTYINKETSQTFTCILYNPTNITLNLLPQVQGTNWQEFRVEPEGPQQILPDECMELTIIFTPRNLGERRAEINLNMPVPSCEPAIIEVFGNGIEAEVIGEGIDYGGRRLLSLNTDNLILDNFGGIPQDILSIELEDQTLTNIFTIPNVDLPYTIDAESTYELPISFTPEQEVDYETNVIVTVTNQENPIILPLRGSGILPKMQVRWDCPDDVNVGVTSAASLIISNPSQSAPLEINSIDIVNMTDEFDWLNAQPLNLTIQEQDEVTFDLIYTPTQNGTGGVIFAIEADNYDGTWQSDWLISEVEYYCDALRIGAENLDFGSTLLCDDNQRDLEIINTSNFSALTVFTNQIEITGANATYFEIVSSNELNIPANETGYISLVYTPQTMGNHSATLSIPNTSGEDLIIELSGTAVSMSLATNDAVIQMKPGAVQSYTLDVNIPQLATGNINELTVQLLYNSKQLGFETETLISNQITNIDNSWQWADPVIVSPGIIEFRGTGNLPTPYNGELFTIDLNAYLVDDRDGFINGKILYGCSDDEFMLTTFRTDEICAYDIRVVNISGVNFEISEPMPNPVGNELSLSFGVGINTHTNINLYDSMGNLIYELVNDRLDVGIYDLRFDTREVSSGVYFIRMNSGPFSETKQIVIQK